MEVDAELEGSPKTTDDNEEEGDRRTSRTEAVKQDVEEEEEGLSPVAVSPAYHLERWLASIPRDDVIALRETQEYQTFLHAFERLGHAHRRVVSIDRTKRTIATNHHVNAHFSSSTSSSSTRTTTAGGRFNQEEEQQQRQGRRTLRRQNDTHSSSSYSLNFLQHLSADDVLLRILEFLECRSLLSMAQTCIRFRQLTHQSATQRTYDVANRRQLNNVMQLLRAKEQIEGIGIDAIHDSHVRVPMLLLSRRILVTNAGDPEMNGVYFCTECNGNGFVFTKPRYPEQKILPRPGDREIQGRNSRTDNGPRTANHHNHNHNPHHRQQQQAQQQHQQQNHRILGNQNPGHPLFFFPPQINGDGDNMDGGGMMNMDMIVVVDPNHIDQNPTSTRFDCEFRQPGQLLRCIISKRFSHEVSEVAGDLPSHAIRLAQTTQPPCVFFFVLSTKHTHERHNKMKYYTTRLSIPKKNPKKDNFMVYE